ncbi:hypothetical protein GGS24DRAFT_498147 [Hypoxylon argillaceum]|nr:hypothetical protein GGS24DRAFT_498147 [Hypoxylon argillaceum]
MSFRESNEEGQASGKGTSNQGTIDEAYLRDIASQTLLPLEAQDSASLPQQVGTSQAPTLNSQSSTMGVASQSTSELQPTPHMNSASQVPPRPIPGLNNTNIFARPSTVAYVPRLGPSGGRVPDRRASHRRTQSRVNRNLFASGSYQNPRIQEMPNTPTPSKLSLQDDEKTPKPARAQSNQNSNGSHNWNINIPLRPRGITSGPQTSHTARGNFSLGELLHRDYSSSFVPDRTGAESYLPSGLSDPFTSSSHRQQPNVPKALIMRDSYDIFNASILQRVDRECNTSRYRNTPGAIVKYHQLAMADDIFYSGIWKGMFMVNQGCIIEYHNPAPSCPQVEESQRADRRLRFILTRDIHKTLGWCRVVGGKALVPAPKMPLPPAEYYNTLNLWLFFFQRAGGSQDVNRYAELVAPTHIDRSRDANKCNMITLGMHPGDSRYYAALRPATPAETDAAATEPGYHFLHSIDINTEPAIDPELATADQPTCLADNVDYAMAVGLPDSATTVTYKGIFPDQHEVPMNLFTGNMMGSSVTNMASAASGLDAVTSSMNMQGLRPIPGLTLTSNAQIPFIDTVTNFSAPLTSTTPFPPVDFNTEPSGVGFSSALSADTLPVPNIPASEPNTSLADTTSILDSAMASGATTEPVVTNPVFTTEPAVTTAPMVSADPIAEFMDLDSMFSYRQTSPLLPPPLDTPSSAIDNVFDIEGLDMMVDGNEFSAALPGPLNIWHPLPSSQLDGPLSAEDNPTTGFSLAEDDPMNLILQFNNNVESSQSITDTSNNQNANEVQDEGSHGDGQGETGDGDVQMTSE